MTEMFVLDLSEPNSTSIEVINEGQTHGGDLLLQADVQDEACSTFPSPYDNDYRGADEANPDAVPNRFDPDDNVFALLPDGTYALYDPRIILKENSLENPLMDGGGSSVLRSTLRAKSGFRPAERAGKGEYFVANDENIVLCANEHPNFLNRGKIAVLGGQFAQRTPVNISLLLCRPTSQIIASSATSLILALSKSIVILMRCNVTLSLMCNLP
jgi:hypothetical protein